MRKLAVHTRCLLEEATQSLQFLVRGTEKAGIYTNVVLLGAPGEQGPEGDRMDAEQCRGWQLTTGAGLDEALQSLGFSDKGSKREDACRMPL